MLSPLIGKLADLFSIQPVLFGVALIPLLSLMLIFKFPEVNKTGSSPN